MRHRKSFNHLSRTASHRKAMLANMAVSLILHKRIETTVAKAKALRRYVEPLITRSKTDTTHSRRIVFSYLQDKEAVIELFSEVAEQVANRPGGYTRIIKLGNRQGDNAEICFIELVDYNDTMKSLKEEASETTTKTRRSRRRKKKSNSNQENPQATTEAKTEEKVEEQKKEETPDSPQEEKE